MHSPICIVLHHTGFPWANGIIWALQLLLSDSIVVWRAWTLYTQQRRLMIIPLALLLATIAMVIAALSLTVDYTTFVNLVYASLYGIALGLSFITNVVVVVMFCFKLWSHRRFMSGLMLRGRRPSRAQTIMTIIIESGLVYCAAQLFIIISEFLLINRGYRPNDFPLKIVTGVLWSLIGMYPTVVMVLVNLQWTTRDAYPDLSAALGSGI
ncbi:hypothetical protein LshimejAT787_1200060 [Lyophyllum shimeji]|uniref:Uncharacterized protein n=1 Tax=Lyophyllum shimeji TaxID=47721 RepID=A0A9P3PWI1_LYOSH|nr:hypothetical protein LshimejAT787_1200060 [Lyophyllum shimeji]